MARRWLAGFAAALVTGVYTAQAVVPAAETSPAPIVGIAPSYGPKVVSAVPNGAAIVRRIWLPGLDAGYDPQGLAVGIYVSAYRSDSLGVRRGPCRVIRIDLETGVPTGYVDVPSPCGHAGGLAIGGDGMLYVADTHTLFATPLAQAFEPGARFRQVSVLCVLAIDALENAAQSSDLSEPAMTRIFEAHRLLIELRAAPKVNAGLLDSNGSVLLGADDI